MSSPLEETISAGGRRDLGVDHEDDGLDGEYSMVADADYPDEVDFYALLGLSSNPPPTDSHIRSAYRNLTLSFHPDKQPLHLRDAARRHFNQIQEAYDVLSDPQKRTVYDMLGADGVRREWGHFGAMGMHGEAASKDVGVKAMSSEQFKHWFLKTMKKRERKAVDSLVESRGTLTIGIDASDAIEVDNDDDVTFHIPSLDLSTFGLNYSFKTPLPLPDFLTATEKETEDEKASIEDPDLGEEEEELLQLTINAGISGPVKERRKRATLQYEDGTEEDIEIPLPQILVGSALELGATVTPNFKGLFGTRGVWNRLPSILHNSSVSFGANLLPVPALTSTVTGNYQPVSGVRPFNLAITSTVQRPLAESLPDFNVQVTRAITTRKVAVLTWTSGLLQWPGFLCDKFPSLGMTTEGFYSPMRDASQLQIGLLSMVKPNVQSESGEGVDEDEDEEAQDIRGNAKIDRTHEAWDTVLTISPEGGGISLNYSRNLFSGKPADDPAKSEWSAEGYYPMARMEEARGVRVKVSSIIGLDGTIQWTVNGTRSIGENTKIGLGMGITANNIAMTVSWKRLGQGINVPVILMPHKHHDAAVLATAIPWAVYCAVEFGYVRPRNRKKRRQAVARRHKELNKLIPKKRAESLEAIELMFDQVQRRQAREESHGGLVITKAEYGYYPSQTKKPKSGFTEPRVVDVTIPVAALVDRGQLVIRKETIKFQMIGFHDPAPLLPKRLKIWYKFQEQEHFVDLGDKEGTACPVRTHIVSE